MRNLPMYLLFFILSLNVFFIKAQVSDYVIIKGEIINLSFAPIQFANIISQQTSMGTFSDNEGKFSLKVLQSDTLIFTAISFRTKKMAVSQLNINQNLIILDSMVYSIAKIDIMDIRWQEFKYNALNTEIKPMDQKILVIKGLPNPYTKLIQINPNLVSNPISAIYEYFKAESIRKRKQGRWNDTYNKTWIKVDGTKKFKP